MPRGKPPEPRVRAPAEPRVIGPGFHEKVFTAVRSIPRGKVATYGQIATMLGSPRVARQVGYALAACDHAKRPVPWHRVINAQGRISHRDEFGRAEQQRNMLEREGVRFDETERVDLARFRWSPPPSWPSEPVDPDLGLNRGGARRTSARPGRARGRAKG